MTIYAQKLSYMLLFTARNIRATICLHFELVPFSEQFEAVCECEKMLINVLK